MKRSACLLLMTFVTLAVAPYAWSQGPAHERANRAGSDRAVEMSVNYEAVQLQFDDAFRRMSNRIQTCVGAVLTVTKAIFRTAKSVVFAFVKVFSRFALAILQMLLQWLLSLLF